jgi:hypothetical protein
MDREVFRLQKQHNIWDPGQIRRAFDELAIGVRTLKPSSCFNDVVLSKR